MTIRCPKCRHENPDDTNYCGKCAYQLISPEDIAVTETIETPKEELTRGTTFVGRYEIIEELGKGGIEKAQAEFEKITSGLVNRYSHGDIYARSFHELGKIYEQKGWNGKAIEQYEKFLGLWKNADPGIEEVEDAKKRLNALLT